MIGGRAVVVRVALIFSLIMISTIFSCQCHDDLCGSGRYRCSNFFDTSPRVHPVRYDFYNTSALFENGDLVVYSFFDELAAYSIPAICGSDSIKDVIFYNQHLGATNYSVYHTEYLPDPADFFNLVITPNKCCKLDTNFQMILEFGNGGPADENLVNAVSVAIDLQGISYITDVGDGSVKIYDAEGRFRGKWANLGRPVHVELFDDVVFILDTMAGCIGKYDMNGNHLGNIPGLADLHDFVSFGFTHDDGIWVIDQNGTRIVEVTISGQLKETKTGYYYQNTNYDFEAVICIEGQPGVFIVADRNANRLLSFSTGPID